jgi:hypothetical protein
MDLHRYVHCILNAITTTSFHHVYMRLPAANSSTSTVITSNLKFYPFFEDADGAVDCTHFPAIPPEEQKAA